MLNFFKRVSNYGIDIVCGLLVISLKILEFTINGIMFLVVGFCGFIGFAVFGLAMAYMVYCIWIGYTLCL